MAASTQNESKMALPQQKEEKPMDELSLYFSICAFTISVVSAVIVTRDHIKLMRRIKNWPKKLR
jgi:hypothetical protein